MYASGASRDGSHGPFETAPFARPNSCPVDGYCAAPVRHDATVQDVNGVELLLPKAQVVCLGFSIKKSGMLCFFRFSLQVHHQSLAWAHMQLQKIDIFRVFNTSVRLLAAVEALTDATIFQTESSLPMKVQTTTLRDPTGAQVATGSGWRCESLQRTHLARRAIRRAPPECNDAR